MKLLFIMSFFTLMLLGLSDLWLMPIWLFQAFIDDEQHCDTYSMKTTVLTEDLWAALDALDAVPEAQQTEWYKRLEEAADAATQAMLLDKGLITEQ